MSFETVTIGPCTRIYSLYERDTLAVRYVGKTVQTLRRRFMVHCAVARRLNRLPVQRWLRKHGGASGVGIALLETVLPDVRWNEREQHWIEVFKSSGAKLLNLTDGGEGACGITWSDETNRKRSLANNRQKEFSCETCGSRFYRKQRDIKNGDCRFCSRGCYAASLAGKHKPIAESIRTAGVLAAAEMRRSQELCKRGHRLNGTNVYLNTAGHRVCKACRKIHKSAYLAKSGATNV